ncbi:MAG TPA: hypothetical protein VJL29_13745 [Thermoguttaceae bacterium]|nr:hypothetical protein [Thermoguttaceae bacterium]
MASVLLAAVLCAATTTGLLAQTPSDQPEKKASPEKRLADEQRRIAEKYRHLEEVLLRMAELTASTDPRRAALLRRAVAESKDRMVGTQFDQMAKLLADGRLSKALEDQKDLDRDLRSLLELLLSENRAKQAASEKARVREYIRRVGQMIRAQKGIQGRTAGGGDAKPLADEQKALAEKAGILAKDVRAHEQKARGDAGKGEPGESEEKQKDKEKQGDTPRGDKRSSDKPKEDGKSDDKPAGRQGQGGQQGQGEGQGGESSESKPASDQQPPGEVQKRLEAARKRMEEARKKLDKAERRGAVDEQEEAIRQLEQAKAELEEILRQLREEEIERMLAFLEARFEKMLDMQRAVYQNTQRLDKTPQGRRGHEHEIEAARLSQKESLIVLEADRALLLLREDATSAAFPEAVSQMRDDMQQVTVRLARAEVGKVTQTIEEGIIAALEEMVEALQKAIKDQEARRGKPQPPGEPQDPPLVDQLAELRMIRALQMRVNRRTVQYSKLIEGEQAQDADLIEALRRLADYEARIHRITRDVESGKSQ